MEQSRGLLESNGVRVAAVSYDSQEVLADFAAKHGIGYPLLSDAGSATIRDFGIFNHNMAPDLRSYGVPHPVEYLVSRDGVVVGKYFVPNYQHRVTASAVALREFGTAANGVLNLYSGAVSVRIALPSSKAFAGQELSFSVRFSVEPGWHIYGAPLPEEYTPTCVSFDDPRVIQQSFELPESAINETLPIYRGTFKGIGTLLLKFPLPEGKLVLKGHVAFQMCSDTVCEPPQRIPFELPLTLGKFVAAE